MNSRLLRYAVVLSGLVLAGCVSTTVDQILASQRPPTSDLRAEIVSKARDHVYDPYSIRDAEISNVMLADPQSGLRIVCVKANAKNLMGGYTGRQVTSLRIMNGKIVSGVANAAICHSPGLHYQHFPELEGLKNI